MSNFLGSLHAIDLKPRKSIIYALRGRLAWPKVWTTAGEMHNTVLGDKYAWLKVWGGNKDIVL